MAAKRLEAPGSKLGRATNWLPDVAFLPEAEGLDVDQLRSKMIAETLRLEWRTH
jgi:hypothetical protein